MRSFDIILMGLKNLFRRKTRTILTVLGVVIGTAAIVVMVSLGIGMNENFNEQLKQMGSLNIINVNKYRNNPDGMSSNPQDIVLDDKTVAAIRAIKGVQAVTPIAEAYVKLVSGKYVAYTPVLGIDAKSMADFDYKIADGRILQEGDVEQIVVGSGISMNFYNPKNMYGGMMGAQGPAVDVMKDKLELTFDMQYGEKRPTGAGGQENTKPAKLYKVKAVGLLEQTNDYQKDYYIYMNLNQLQKMIKDNNKQTQGQGNSFGMSMYGGASTTNGYERIMVMVKNINDVDAIQKQIDEMGYGTSSLADIRKPMQKQAQTIQLVLGGIGAISLLISALGITNTMIMSIYERTREIGVMKVLGCKMKNIRQLFLFESGIIGFIGGLVGVLLSYLTSWILNTVGKGFMNLGGMGFGMGMGGETARISVIPLWLALLSVVFAILIGLISGFSPARRAMKLSALEAIKSE